MCEILTKLTNEIESLESAAYSRNDLTLKKILRVREILTEQSNAKESAVSLKYLRKKSIKEDP